jgi:hypothetical protein
LGSRVIITTRNKYLLNAHGVDSTYQVNELDENEALQLFCRHAFKIDEPNDGFVELTQYAIRYCGGLPLALTVLGSTLKGRDVLYWESKLYKDKRIPNKKIQEILRISYDELEDIENDIFLDIACFFKGKDVDYVTKILDSCVIEELKDKCLVTQSYKSLEMHDLLQEMGRKIVRQESPKEPGKHSRLWLHEDVCHVLKGNTVIINYVKNLLLILDLFLFHELSILKNIDSFFGIKRAEKLHANICMWIHICYKKESNEAKK